MPELKFLSSRWTGRLQAVILIIIFAAIAVTISRLWENIRDIQWQLNLSLLILSIVLVTLAILGWAVAWSWMLNRITVESIPLPNIIDIYLYGNLAKYVPGSVWNYLARGYLGHKKGMRQRGIWIASIIEIFVSICTGLILYIVSLKFPHAHKTYIPSLILGFLVIILLSIISPIMFDTFQKLLQKFREESIQPEAIIHYNWISYAGYLGLSILAWFIIGIAFYFLVISIYPLPVRHLPELIGIWSLSVVIGLIAIGIPQGFGIKEGILAWALSAIMPLPVAFSIALLSRFWIIANELFATLIWRVLRTSITKIIQKDY